MPPGADPLHLPPPRRRRELTAAHRVNGRRPSPTRPCRPRRPLPLLAPMSEVAGRMAPQSGAKLPGEGAGGRGVLMGGVSGVPPAKWSSSARAWPGRTPPGSRPGMEAEVIVVDKNVDKLRFIDQIHKAGSMTLDVRPARRSSGACARPTSSSARSWSRGRRRRKLVTEEMVARDAAGRGDRRHLDRPGRVRRDLPHDDALRSHVRGARRRALLRRQHAGRGPEHVDVRADERDAAVRARDRRATGSRTRSAGPALAPGRQRLRRAR